MEKINLTVLVSSLHIGGAEQALLEMLRNIDRGRFDIRVLFLRSPEAIGREVMDLGLTVQADILSGRFDVPGVFRLARLLRGTRVLLLINHLDSLFYGVAAARLARVPAVINWENEMNKHYRFPRITHLGRRILHLGVDRVVAAAKGHRDYIIAVEGITPEKVEVIYNGVDPSRYKSRLTDGEARARLGIGPEDPVAGIVAGLRPDKAHGVFLKAMHEVLKRLPAARALVVGDGSCRGQLEQQARELGIAKNVNFLGFRRDLADVFAALDIHVLSSDPSGETFSVSALETMAVGIPAVCTDVGAMREIVLHGQNGYLVKPGDCGELADRMVQLLQDGPLRKRMGEAARVHVLENMTAQQMARGFERLMEAF